MALINQSRELSYQNPKETKSPKAVEDDGSASSKEAVAFDGYNGAVSDESPTLGINCGMSTGRNGVMFSAGFKAGQGSGAGIGYEVECAASLTSGGSGLEPSVLVSESEKEDSDNRCLNPWDIQSKHIQPENGVAEPLYAGECRYGGGESYVMDDVQHEVKHIIESSQDHATITDGEISTTLTASMGIGGGYVPMVQEDYVYPIEGNGSRPSHKGSGVGDNGDPSFTLNGTEYHAVCYGISSDASNAMKSSNPHSGIYEADTARTLDMNGGNPSCNQGGIAVCYRKSRRAKDQDDAETWIESDVANTLNTFDSGDTRTSQAIVTVCSSGVGKEDSNGSSGESVHGCQDANVYNNHPSDGRATETSGKVVDTLSSRMGTGGNNTPLVVAAVDCRNGTENPYVNGTLQAKSNGGYNMNSNNVVRVPLSFQERAGRPGGGKGILIQEDKTGALCSAQTQAVLTEGTVEQTAKVYDAQRRHDYRAFGDVCETVQASYGEGGNNVPLVLHQDRSEVVALNDQGGQQMYASKDVVGTLRAQEHGHPPVIIDTKCSDTEKSNGTETE